MFTPKEKVHINDGTDGNNEIHALLGSQRE
jgi:hypothetical protein